eukprot:359855_1
MNANAIQPNNVKYKKPVISPIKLKLDPISSTEEIRFKQNLQQLNDRLKQVNSKPKMNRMTKQKTDETDIDFGNHSPSNDDAYMIDRKSSTTVTTQNTTIRSMASVATTRQTTSTTKSSMSPNTTPTSIQTQQTVIHKINSDNSEDDEKENEYSLDSADKTRIKHIDINNIKHKIYSSDTYELNHSNITPQSKTIIAGITQTIDSSHL